MLFFLDFQIIGSTNNSKFIIINRKLLPFISTILRFFVSTIIQLIIKRKTLCNNKMYILNNDLHIGDVISMTVCI